MLTRLEGLALPASHPFAGRHAYQCSECRGISYPPGLVGRVVNVPGCPYCTDELDELLGAIETLSSPDALAHRPAEDLLYDIYTLTRGRPVHG